VSRFVAAGKRNKPLPRAVYTAFLLASSNHRGRGSRGEEAAILDDNGIIEGDAQLESIGPYDDLTRAI